MISRVLKGSVVTHGVALLLGFGAVVIFAKQSETGETSRVIHDGSRSDIRDRKPVGRYLSSSGSFRTAYGLIASRPMSRDERRALRNDLFEEWGNRDPQGLLAFLDKKSVWPNGFSFYSDLGNLELDRPDLLLDFAIRNGCEDALVPLERGDPVVIARLIDALPAPRKGSELLKLRDVAYQKMGKQGITTASPSAANLQGAAESMLEDGRLEEFFHTFGEIDDAAVRSKLAQALGRSLGYERLDQRVLGTICNLPRGLQINATSELFRNSGAAMAFPEAREDRRHWIDQFAAQGLAEGAAHGIGDLFEAGDHDRVNEEIVAWVRRWPDDGSLLPLVEALISEWSSYDRVVMIRELAAMPDGRVRNRLAAAALRDGQLGESDYPDVKALISDPEILKLFEPGADWDPFADPFAEPPAK